MRHSFGFLFSALVGLFVLSHGYVHLKAHLGEEPILRDQVASLQSQLAQERFRVALKEGEIQDIKSMVARQLPGFLKEEQSYQARNIASVVSTPKPLKIDVSEPLFAEGQKLFQERAFKKSAEVLARFTEQYPVHERTTEAYFLLTESLYLSGDYPKTLGMVKTMMTQFPENPLTGYSLLRMGQVLQERSRLKDAKQIFESVLENYEEPKLKLQAKKLSGEIKL